MENIILLFAGALLGVIIDRISPFTGLDDFLKRVFLKWKTPKKILSGITPHLSVGKLILSDWEILDGLFPDGIKIITSIEPIEIVLPNDLQAIRKNIENELLQKKLQNLPVPYNGKSYALVGCKFHRVDDSFETNTCHLKFKYSDYFNFLATSNSLDVSIPNDNLTVREKYYINIDPTEIKNDFLYHSFGVNLSVITKDQRLVIVKRGDNVDILSGVFNSSMNEGVSRDLDQETNSSISIEHVALRGMNEELGVNRHEIDELYLTSIGFSRKWCQHGVLGHVLLNITFEDLKRRLPISKDAGFEIECKKNRL